MTWLLALLACFVDPQTKSDPRLLPTQEKAAPSANSPSAAPEGNAGKRTELNLVGQVDTDSGESRRNENVHFNLIDNNALKELGIRLGVTATIVDEFHADRRFFGSEFGARPTAPLHLPARSDTSLHGSVHATHNNSVFSARSFFQVGGVKPARENDYGFHVGAPLWNGAFLSVRGSQQKIRGSVNGNILAPKLDERTPLATDPAVRSVVERYLSAYPREAPNRTDSNERALNTNAPQVVDGDDASIRLDHVHAGRDRLTSQSSFTSQVVDAFQLVAGQNPDTTTKSHAPRLTWSRQWSAQTVTEFTVGYDRLRSLLAPEANAVGPLVLTGFVVTFLGPSESLPIDRVENKFRYAGLLRQVRGPHTWTAGFEIRRRQVNGYESNAHRGIVHFASDFGRDALTNFRLGTPSRYQVAVGDPARGFRNWEPQYFIGDSWKIGRALQLDFGLRWEMITTPSEVNRLSTVPYPCDCNNLSPSFGFSYRAPGRWGVVRAAYGLHYGEIFATTYGQVRFNPPRDIQVVIPAPYLPDPLRALRPGDLAPNARSSIRRISPDLVAPYSHQYNFSWEPEIGRQWKLQFGYVGSRSVKLFMLWYQNRAAPVPGVPLTSETINLRRPDTGYFDIYHLVNASRGYYDAGKVTLVVPRWRRLSLDVAYWFSKAIDLGSDYTNTAFDNDGRLTRSPAESPVLEDMKGLSQFDQTHSFLMRVSWATPAAAAGGRWKQLLGQWNLSAVVLHKTGTPFLISSGSDGPGFGNVDGLNGDRPDVLDPSILGRTISDPDTSRTLLPRSAFGFTEPGRLRGTLGRHVFRKGGIGNINASLARTWGLGQERRLTFRAESINFFNTPQFAEPGRELSAPNFGEITNTLNDGRTFRFQLRVDF